MANKCDICGRTPQFGHNVSHSKRRTNHMWGLNVHKQTVFVDAVPVRAHVCSRCLRTMNKQSKS
jgi:large subunit ribosomal protein L28